MIQVDSISAFTDNYIWCIHDHSNAWVVDPGDASPVISYLDKHHLTLKGILVTHHHPDHIGGLGRLKSHYRNIEVVGPVSSRIPDIDRSLSEGDAVYLDGLDSSLEVLEVPAHTREHIAFYGELGLFCGDTLFSAGCGRLFEGTAEQMHNNLQRFAALPEDTKVYCAHEYTKSNNLFALAILPEDDAFVHHQAQITDLRNQGRPTIPTTIGLEKKVNPFMRVEEPSIAESVNKHTKSSLNDATEVFKAMRHWKDTF